MEISLLRQKISNINYQQIQNNIIINNIKEELNLNEEQIIRVIKLGELLQDNKRIQRRMIFLNKKLENGLNGENGFQVSRLNNLLRQENTINIRFVIAYLADITLQDDFIYCNTQEHCIKKFEKWIDLTIEKIKTTETGDENTKVRINILETLKSGLIILNEEYNIINFINVFITKKLCRYECSSSTRLIENMNKFKKHYESIEN